MGGTVLTDELTIPFDLFFVESDIFFEFIAQPIYFLGILAVYARFSGLMRILWDILLDYSGSHWSWRCFDI